MASCSNQITGSPSSPFKRLRMSSGSVARQEEAYVPFTELAPGVDRVTKVMVCRRWDAANTAGKYISTEFILSDFTGNAIHCVARSSIAHCFASKLEVGEIYSIRRFTVHPNKETYRLRNSDVHLIQLEGNSVVKKIQCSSDGFERHPFQLQDFEYIVLNGNRFLIDVVGSVVNMGKVKPTKNGSQFLEFQLCNERGFIIKVTIWGALCDDLVRRVRGAPELYIILLTSMNVKEYRGEIFLSSTSATCIYDSDEISEISQLRQAMDGMVVPQPNHDGTLLRLLQLGRQLSGLNRQHSVTMFCPVRVLGIRERNSWHYFSCGAANCRKGLTRVENSFWCESCDRVCDFPVPKSVCCSLINLYTLPMILILPNLLQLLTLTCSRFRLELDVSDPTTTVAVTVFDEIAESMVNKAAAIYKAIPSSEQFKKYFWLSYIILINYLLKAHEDDDENEIPHEVLQLVNTTHVLELKTHTYYDHGDYESFTVSRLIRTIAGADITPLDTDKCNEAEGKVTPGIDGKGMKAAICAEGATCEEDADSCVLEKTTEAFGVPETVEGVKDVSVDPTIPVTTPKKTSELDVETSP